MAHNCIDWTTTPPARKVPFLVLSYGDDRVYTSVPKELKTLEDIARKEFNLGDADIKISSSCMNLCGGLPARITESAWEHMSPYVGCATIEVVGLVVVEAPPPQELPPEPENAAAERDAGDPLNADKGNESDRGPGEAAREAVPDEDHQEDHDPVSAPEKQRDEPEEEEVGLPSSRKVGHRRRVVSENENEGDESEEERTIPARSQISALASPPKPAKAIKKERQSDYHSQTDAEQPGKPIKREKPDTSSANYSQSQAQSDTRSQAPTEPSENIKLVIRVAHRPSTQESKFTTKSATKVNKVLASACRSFGLDASRATLYLIVSMVDEEDGEVESLFPCDKNDTIARAGAETHTESRFLLKVVGEA
ncbi:hypothetical protein EV363DRAFT_1329710 [Boletus edulis]|nr:hypothetical protein EV363DRAFT_1329710 [Boletus edulis]